MLRVTVDWKTIVRPLPGHGRSSSPAKGARPSPFSKLLKIIDCSSSTGRSHQISMRDSRVLGRATILRRADTTPKTTTRSRSRMTTGSARAPNQAVRIYRVGDLRVYVGQQRVTRE